jgi:hypothetical protein
MKFAMGVYREEPSPQSITNAMQKLYHSGWFSVTKCDLQGRRCLDVFLAEVASMEFFLTLPKAFNAMQLLYYAIVRLALWVS